MTKRIFKGIIFTSILTILASMIFIIGVQYRIYRDEQLSALESKVELIANAVESGADIENFGKYEERITLVLNDGTVIFDNEVDKATMDNHSDRSEIEAAFKNGSGFSIRHSDTLSKNICYYAVRLNDGSVLRIAETQITVFTVILQLLPPISAIIVLTFLLALILAYIITGRILKPINSINLEDPRLDSEYEELNPLITKLRFQKNKIKRQISELTQSRREFEIISDNMSEGMLITDTKGIILTHNKSIEKIFGKTQELDGKNLLVLSRSDSFGKIFEGVVENTHTETEFSLDGRVYNITENPVIDENGIPCGAVIFIIDTTEKLERERMRREFTANVSHELKTPLTSILGFSELIKSGAASGDDAKEFASDIHRETNRLIALVNDIIKLSRLDGGEFKVESEKINLKNTVCEIAERLKGIAESKQVTFTVSGGNTEITAPEAQVFEMLYNLCDNAIKYNRTGGSVSVTVGTNGNRPFVSVKDTGIGIPIEHQERIFERFYTVDKSRSRMGGGTGLGLSIVKHTAAAIGAEIELYSEPDKGTEIKVSF